MNREFKKITRYIGQREFEGVVSYENGKYNYFFQYAAELGKKMTAGDINKIAKLTKIKQEYVSMVLKGKRWHEEILRTAEIFAKRNVEMGFIELEAEIICN